MAKIIYNKLIRDKIPEIITASGKQYETEVMPDAEYLAALKEKLVEEALEAKSAAPEELVKELADVLEVLDYLMRANGITDAMVRGMQQKRYEERGGFDKKLKLLWTRNTKGS